MKMTNEQVNNKEAVIAEIRTVDKIHEVLNERAQAAYFNKDLDVIHINDALYFDKFGKFARLKMNSSFKNEAEILENADIPYSTTRCTVCGDYFRITDIPTMVIHKNNMTGVRKFTHGKCHTYNTERDALTEIKNVFDNMIMSVRPIYKMVPNEYNQDSEYPWFIVDTVFGSIKIGRRDNTYYIEWLDDFMQFTDDFNDVKSSKSFGATRILYAWNTSLCTEYIERSILSIKDKAKVRKIYAKNNRIFNSLRDSERE